MLVKINGQIVVGEQHQVQTVKSTMTERKKSSISKFVPIATAAVAALSVLEPSIAHATTTAAVHESGADQFQDVVIKSLPIDVMIMAALFAFKRQWFKTFGITSAIVYGGFFCAETIGMMLAVFFTWLNHTLEHWLQLVRMG